MKKTLITLIAITATALSLNAQIGTNHVEGGIAYTRYDDSMDSYGFTALGNYHLYEDVNLGIDAHVRYAYEDYQDLPVETSGFLAGGTFYTPNDTMHLPFLQLEAGAVNIESGMYDDTKAVYAATGGIQFQAYSWLTVTPAITYMDVEDLPDNEWTYSVKAVAKVHEKIYVTAKYSHTESADTINTGMQFRF